MNRLFLNCFELGFGSVNIMSRVSPSVKLLRTTILGIYVIDTSRVELKGTVFNARIRIYSRRLEAACFTS